MCAERWRLLAAGRGRSAPVRITFTSLRRLLHATPAAIVLTWGLWGETSSSESLLNKKKGFLLAFTHFIP